MGIVVDPHQGAPPSENEIIARMRAEGLTPHGWGNAPGETYGWHEHSYEKVLYCVRGRIVFHTDTGDADLGPGRPAGAATAHPSRSHGQRRGRALR